MFELIYVAVGATLHFLKPVNWNHTSLYNQPTIEPLPIHLLELTTVAIKVVLNFTPTQLSELTIVAVRVTLRLSIPSQVSELTTVAL